MNLDFKKYTFSLVIIMTILCIVHLLIYSALPNFLNISLKILFEIYGFLILLNLVHFIALKWLFNKWAKHAGLLFTGLSLLKMGICIIYLWPYVYSSTTSALPVVLNFMTVYFATLFFEVIFIIKSMLKGNLKL